MRFISGPRSVRLAGEALILIIISLFVLLQGAESSGAEARAQEQGKPKVILLGFDGVDFGLAKGFIEEGHLPHLEALHKTGTFAPLATTNPAQSPVAWAAIVTGTNPGKTNIGGFIRRNFQGERINPQLATVEESYDRQKHTVPYSGVSWLGPDSQWLLTGGFGLGFFLITLVILSLLLRLKFMISFSVSLVMAAVAVFFGVRLFNEIPETVPFPYNLQQGEYFWDILSRNEINTVGLYAPGAYPVVGPDRADLLGGLGVPDINGGTGTWYIYSSEAFTFFDMETNTGGKVIRLNEEGDGRLLGKVFGPTNFFQMEKFEKQVEALRERKDNPKLTGSEKEDAETAFREVQDEFENWKDEDTRKKATQDLWITPDFGTQSATFELAGRRQELKEGEWSKWFKLTFKLTPFLKVPALLRLRLIKCSEEEVRFFVPAIDISPEGPPPYLRISSPAGYSSTLADRVGGPFETVGWACITHGLKDEEIEEDVFMEDIEFTMQSRLKLMRDQLERKDWDVFFEVFYSTDRVQHMMYRIFDENHPQHDSQLAQRNVYFFREEIRLKDSILETYKAMDDIVGEVMSRIEEGHFGDDVLLMIVSDHGFAPFYHCMGINNFLVEKGFMILLPDASGEPQTVKSMVASGRDNYLMFVDWEKTRAYSLGLGKVFINLKGREPDGIVEKGDYDSVRDEIIRAFLEYKDPGTGERVVKNVYKREEIFSGDFWKEGETDFQFYKLDGQRIKEHRMTEGFADLYMGFMPKYRVSWQTSLGGLEETVIVPNHQKWSGDHVSVDPSEVVGVFFSNRKMNVSGMPSLVDIVPTVLSCFGIKTPDHMDGRPIELEP